MERLLAKWDTLIVLTAQSEPGLEDRLIKFYSKFGFKVISDESITPVTMTYIPHSYDKLKSWTEFIEKSYQEYSFEKFNTRHFLPIWGRRYAPWLKYSYNIYKPLLIEMHSIMKGLEGPKE